MSVRWTHYNQMLSGPLLLFNQIVCIMNTLPKIHLMYRSENERQAARFEQLYLDGLSKADQRVLALAEQSPVVDLHEAAVVVVLLDAHAAQDVPLKKALQHYVKNGRCPMVGVLLHDHPRFEAGTTLPQQLPKALAILQQQGASFHAWSNNSKKIHEWITAALGSQPSRA